MSVAETLMKEQDAVRVCRFCGKEYDYYRRDDSGRMPTDAELLFIMVQQRVFLERLSGTSQGGDG
ncbi:MAG: hypothetical protein H6Q30_1150 [Bacteroidetes bacterium]|nr:hypothetical protein [Bacteroidota bacterium]